MNIKNAEERTGLSRANIRFYEQEGLICPARSENGYRNYSESDIQELNKCRLLRALGVPVSQIRSAREGTVSLSSILEQRQKDMAREQEDLEAADRICSRMRRDGAEFSTLDAPRYLEEMAHPVPPEKDQAAEPWVPFRRFFARGLDFQLYSLIVDLLLFFHVSLLYPGPVWKLVRPVLVLLLTLALEPVLLHLFGATFGKWVLGLSVTDLDGGRLSRETARDRTRGVLISGEGLLIPVWSLVRNWKSYRAYEQGEALSWEGGPFRIEWTMELI